MTAPTTLEVDDAPERHGGTAFRWVAAVVVLAVVFGGGAAIGRWALGSDDSSAAPPPPRTTGSSTAPAEPTSGDTAALPSLVVQQADVESAVNVQLIDFGNTVSGDPTLDICNGTFPSETLRRARLQDVAFDGRGRTLLSTEAVLYTNEAAAQQAFRELERVAAKCPDSPVESPVGEPTVTSHFNARPDSAWPDTPTVTRQAYSITTTDEKGATDRTIAVYLRRGRALLGVYFPNPTGTQSAVRGHTTIPAIVKLFATRLARLPASTVND
jgi:hypothetical protein